MCALIYNQNYGKCCMIKIILKLNFEQANYYLVELVSLYLIEFFKNYILLISFS